MTKTQLLSLLLLSGLLASLAPVRTTPSPLQLNEIADNAEQSALSRAMRRSGSLLQRESHELPELDTLGNPIKCTVLVLRDLLTSSDMDAGVNAGLVLSVKEKHGEQSVYIDTDEIAGLRASISFVQEQGLKTIAEPLVDPARATSRSTEIHYQTRENVTLGVFERGGKLLYALKVGRRAEWAILSKEGVAVLEANLEAAEAALQAL